MKTVLATATAAVALALPAAASGATLTALGGTCFVSGAPITLTGTGWTPGATVFFDGGASGSGTVDAAGNLVGDVTPFSAQREPKDLTIAATERGAPAPGATVTFPVISDLYVVDANLNGRPRSKVRWRFVGFEPGKPVYGHFRFKGRTIRNYRFGTAKGRCGTLTARARRLPVRKLRYGTWKLKFDSRRSYSPKTPGRLGRLTIFRSFG